MEFLSLAKNIASVRLIALPPDEGTLAETYQIIPPAVVRSTRGYIERVANQVNGAYERGWYDCCAVMMRRLLETVIIETFESHGIQSKIIGSGGEYYYLRDLISAALSEPSWNLTRNTKAALPKLKELGDKSAHSRRYIAHRQDIEPLASSFRGVIQEFVYLANLK
ncbi:MAG TPA: hypothetical protein P5121_20440 [Caldilineaceae bacterium]|nr:hypothetical protein [Caldilineaceae bacterium]